MLGKVRRSSGRIIGFSADYHVSIAKHEPTLSSRQPSNFHQLALSGDVVEVEQCYEMGIVWMDVLVEVSRDGYCADECLSRSVAS